MKNLRRTSKKGGGVGTGVKQFLIHLTRDLGRGEEGREGRGESIFTEILDSIFPNRWEFQISE